MLRLGYVSHRLCASAYISELPPQACLSYSRDWHILQLVEEHLNIRFESYQAETFGSKIANTSSWNGMVGMLINGSIDITEPGLAETYDRHSVVDFAYAASFVRPSAFLACERVDEIKSNYSLSSIFTVQVWLAFFLSAIAIALQYTIVIKFSTKLQLQDSSTGAFRKLLDPLTAPIHGQKLHLHSTPLRIAEACWAFCLLVLIQGFLAAALYESAQVTPISPLQDWKTFVANVRVGKFAGIAMVAGTANEQLLLSDKRFAAVRDRLMAMTMAETDRVDLLRYARHDDYERVVNAALAWEANGMAKCYTNDFGVTPLKWFTFGVAKRSPFLAKLNAFILSLHEYGILIEISRRADVDWLSSPREPKASIGLDHIVPALELCGCLFLIGFVTFLVERRRDYFLTHSNYSHNAT